MVKIFISYRREDSQHAVDRLQQEIHPYLKNPENDLFVDIDHLPIGVDFESHLQNIVDKCDAVLAVIGPAWLSAETSDGKQRILQDNDFVRMEIATALRRGIPVVPVLLDGTPIPPASALPEDIRTLVKRNGVQLDRKSFRADVAHIMRRLGFKSPEQKSSGRWRVLVALAIIAVSSIWVVQNFDLLTPTAPVETATGSPESAALYSSESSLPKVEPEGGTTGTERTEEKEASARDGSEFASSSPGGHVSEEPPPASEAPRAETSDPQLTQKKAASGSVYAQPRPMDLAQAEQIFSVLSGNKKAIDRYQDELAGTIVGRVPEDPSNPYSGPPVWDQIPKADWAILEPGPMVDRVLPLTGLTALKKAAAEGNANAQTILGSVYWGHGAIPDYPRSRQYFESGCKGENMAACSYLGLMYSQGMGLRRDPSQAARLYLLGCDGGNMIGCHNLGYLHENGYGVEKDPEKAKQYYRMSCDGGNAIACQKLR